MSVRMGRPRHVDRGEAKALLERGISRHLDVDDDAASAAADSIALWLYANGFTMLSTTLEVTP